MRTKRTVSIVAALVIALTFIVALAANRSLAFTSTERLQINFSTVGLTRGQNARLNVTHLESSVQLPPPCVELSFVDSDGNEMLPAVQRPLEAGHTTFLFINGDDVAPREGRIQLRPVVRVLDCQASRGNERLNFSASLEIVDHASAKTTLLYPGKVQHLRPAGDN